MRATEAAIFKQLSLIPTENAYEDATQIIKTHQKVKSSYGFQWLSTLTNKLKYFHAVNNKSTITSRVNEDRQSDSTFINESFINWTIQKTNIVCWVNNHHQEAINNGSLQITLWNVESSAWHFLLAVKSESPVVTLVDFESFRPKSLLAKCKVIRISSLKYQVIVIERNQHNTTTKVNANRFDYRGFHSSFILEVVKI